MSLTCPIIAPLVPTKRQMMPCPRPVDPAEPSLMLPTSLQRLVLHHDGTLTDLIEALVAEPIGLEKLEHRPMTAGARDEALDLDRGEPLVERRINLHGRLSRTIYVYAETRVAVQRLPSALSHALETSDTPLGRLCRQHRLELYREPVTWQARAAGRLSGPLRTGDETMVFARCYRMLCGGRPAVLIREFFAPVLWRAAGAVAFGAGRDGSEPASIAAVASASPAN